MVSLRQVTSSVLSHPVRGAWVEIPEIRLAKLNVLVAPREGCVG